MQLSHLHVLNLMWQLIQKCIFCKEIGFKYHR